ncbi:MAG: SLC13 family permease, partial [Longimicrobiales bacterium]|nr:SLC13 family permease [Longimicrobiales bacterium]
MSYELAFVLGLVVVTVALFVSEKFPVDVVALIALGVLLVSGILPPEEALAGFSNEAVITIGAMFVLSSGLNHSGTLEVFGRNFRAAAQKTVFGAVAGLMVAVGVTSAFINNTAVVAILLPVVVAVSRDLDLSASKLLMPLSFASMFGGVCTLVGTSTNLLVSSIADDHGLAPFGMFEFSALGLIFFAAGTVYMLTVGMKLTPERRKPEQLAQSWRVEEYLTELVLSADSDSVGYKIEDAPLTRDLDLDVVKIRRPGRGPLPTMTDMVLQADDALVVRCNVNQLRRLLQKEGVIIEPRARWREEDLEPREMVLVEAVVAPNSMLEGETIRTSDFRDRLGGTVIAIRHRGALKREDLNEVRLSAGDALLVETTRERLPQFRRSAAFVLVSDEPIQEFRPSKAVPALAILAFVVGTAALGVLPIVAS